MEATEVRSEQVESALLTRNQVLEKYPAITSGMLAWWLFHRRTNGLDACTLKIGRRVLLDEARFLEWIESHREA